MITCHHCHLCGGKTAIIEGRENCAECDIVQTSQTHIHPERCQFARLLHILGLHNDIMLEVLAELRGRYVVDVSDDTTDAENGEEIQEH